ncbi:MAG: TenA family protein [Candidatus Aramenus sp.]|nr:TenA family protein [Candidatus Aramenus sp.]
MNSDALKESVGELWEKYVRHDFVKRMKDGSLPLENFRYYLIQDSKYVRVMLKSLLNASSKGPIDQVSKIILKVFQTRDKGSEVHSFLLSQLKVTEREIQDTGYSLVNYAYTRHLFYHSNLGWKQFLVAWAPCMWGYMEVGEYVLGSPNPLYNKWAEFYSSQDYRTRVEAILEALNSVDLDEGLFKVFMDSVNFEIMFWDSSMRMDPTPFHGD